jgi:uncharacterized protein (TIGR02271 family)
MAPTDQELEERVLPVIEETVQIEKNKVETGRVRVTKHVREHEETADTPLFREEVQVERVPVNQMVEERPSIREEGEITIVPVIEEVLVVQKKLMLKEELHIKRVRTEFHQPKKVVLRGEEVTIEHLPPNTVGE